MTGERALPERASLRFLKLAAKRRHAAGEFPTLHAAQQAVARENGQPSWAALSHAVAASHADSGREGHALTQLRWILTRFAEAGQPGWAAPTDDELRGHFTGQFLAAVPPDRLTAMISELAPALRGELAVDSDAPFIAHGRLSGYLVSAATEPRSPFRLSAVRARRLGERISDPRVAEPPVTAAGPLPAQVPGVAAAAWRRLGMVGLAVAGADGPGRPRPAPWTATTGWASLEDGEPLRAGHAFPVYQVTAAVTAVAVLCLAAAGQVRLDDPASGYLATVRLADDTVTVRELLSHTGGVTDPPGVYARSVPALAAVFAQAAGPALTAGADPVISCAGKRGTFGHSLAGYAALGEVVAGRTGLPCTEALTRLVLRPLGMSSSWFPARWPGDQPGERGFPAVTGYDVAADDTFTPAEQSVCVFPAAGGLWATAADLVRLGLGWRSLLPRSLAEQALRPHAAQPSGVQTGLGWMINEPAGLVGLIGDGPGGAASLLVKGGGRQACAALVNRQVPAEPVTAAVLGVFDRPGRG